MHNINDEMDELLRRAAEDYPLHTDSSDWNKVFSALTSDNSPIPASKERYPYRLTGLLLLLLLPLMCDYFFEVSDRKAVLSSIVPGQASKVNAAPGTERQPGKKEALLPKENHGDDRAVSATSFSGHKEYSPVPASRRQADPTARSGPGQPSTPVLPAVAATKTPATKSQQNGNSSFNDKKDIALTVSEKPAASNSPVSKNNPAGESVSTTGQPVTQPPAKTDTASPQDAARPSVRKTQERALYLSLVAGADGSTIKLQSVRAGYNLGVLAGFRFYKKWLVEAGVFWSEKSYYSDGEHVSSNKIYVPANAHLKDVAGVCHMIEIPVALRFDFTSTGRRKWFSTLGLSSYIMKKEDYEYTYDRQGWSYDYYKTYKNATTNLFSVAYLGLGVEQKIGKTTSVRVEPYIKMPLKGLGIGSLPISSLGLNVGFTKRIF